MLLNGSISVFKSSPKERERSGTVVHVECFTRDRGVAGPSLTDVTALCLWARHIYSCLVLFQIRNTRPNITEKIIGWDISNKSPNEKKR